jgi:hypothetical protein
MLSRTKTTPKPADDQAQREPPPASPPTLPPDFPDVPQNPYSELQPPPPSDAGFVKVTMVRSHVARKRFSLVTITPPSCAIRSARPCAFVCILCGGGDDVPD